VFFKKKYSFNENDLKSIIIACLKKDRLAERTLIKLFYTYVKTISEQYVGNNEELDEIINDVFLKVFTNLHKYNIDLSFKSWLKTIVINTAIDYYRKNKKYAYNISIDEIEVIDFHDDVIMKITSDEILAFIQQLPPSYRIVFTLYVIEGYTHREIAEMMGIQEGTSKSNLRDARKKLQQLIKIAYPHLFFVYSLHKNITHEN
jgi:RNA polymerase sigma-70 factor (ECF subfamily)